MIKKQIIYSKDEASLEATINCDLGIATGDLVLRQTDQMYAYQELYDLGQPLSKKVISLKSLAERVDFAIKALLKVDALHQGKLSKTGTPYVHLDIKPDNILIDSNDEVHLIDFGSASTDLTESNVKIYITPAYSAIDKVAFEDATYEGPTGALVATIPNFQTHDRIAILRTIYNPIVVPDYAFEKESIFDTNSFNQLPPCLKTLLDTSTIAPHLTDQRVNETEAFLAAVLIQYQKNMRITQAEIDQIRASEILQTQIIQRYERNQRIHSLDKNLAKKLLAKAEKKLLSYHLQLTQQKQVDPDLADKKDILITRCLVEVYVNHEPQVALAKIDEFLCQHYLTLSQKQTRQESNILNKIISFFSKLFGSVKGQAVVEDIEKSLDKALGPAHKEYRKTTTEMRKHSLFKSKAHEIPEGKGGHKPSVK